MSQLQKQQRCPGQLRDLPSWMADTPLTSVETKINRLTGIASKILYNGILLWLYLLLQKSACHLYKRPFIKAQSYLVFLGGQPVVLKLVMTSISFLLNSIKCLRLVLFCSDLQPRS